MIALFRALSACALVGMLAACSGRTLALDQNLPAATPNDAGTGAFGNVESVNLTQSVWYFRVQGARIFWQSDGIYSCEFERCGETFVSYPAPTPVALVGATASDVFYSYVAREQGYTSTNSLAHCPWGGCNGSPQTLIQDDSGSGYGWGAAFDENYVYWQSTFNILRCPLTGCGATPELVVADGPGQGFSLVLREKTVFYVPYLPEANDYELRSVPKDGSTPPTTLVHFTDQSNPSPAVGADAIYWVDSNGSIRSCPLAGCNGAPATTVVDSPARKIDLRVDDSGIYWNELADAQQVGGKVRFCPLSGCPAGQEPNTLIDGSVIEQFELDARYVYWTEYVSTAVAPSGQDIDLNAPQYTSGPQIYRMPKPQPAQ